MKSLLGVHEYVRKYCNVRVVQGVELFFCLAKYCPIANVITQPQFSVLMQKRQQASRKIAPVHLCDILRSYFSDDS